MVNKSALLLAQVTDIHLFAQADQQLLGLPTADSFAATIAQLQRLRPQLDFLLLTGDLSQDGTAASYDRLQTALAPLNLPTYWLPGNHDDFAVMQRSLTKPPFLSDKSFQAGDWQFILLNSAVPGCVHGQLPPESLDWLEEQLNHAADCPTVVSFHHPPFQVHSDWLDTSILQNPTDLFAVLDRHPQVKLVLFGHIHQAFHRQRRGIHYFGSPSTSIQFEPQSSHFSLDRQQPGFRLLELYSDGTWQTEIRRVNYAHQMDLAATGY
jgi:3',5'-cyclic-AMP phosphodiesterase